MKILVIEDERKLSENIVTYLSSSVIKTGWYLKLLLPEHLSGGMDEIIQSGKRKYSRL